MTNAELLALTRELLRDEVAPYLFSDTIIYRYLNDAQKFMAERTFCIVDYENYDLTTVANTRSYTLDNEEVLQILGARIVGETTPLKAGFAPVSDAFFSNSSGQPTNYTTTGGRLQISFAPTPDAAYAISLVVAIRPTTDISATNSSKTSEIPVTYHTALADYAASKCLLHNDVDGLNVASSASFANSYMEAVRDLKRQIYQYRLGPDANVVPMRIT